MRPDAGTARPNATDGPPDAADAQPGPADASPNPDVPPNPDGLPDTGRELVDPTRRQFLARITLGISAGVGAAVVVPWVVLLFSPVLRPDPRAWRRVGQVEDFPVGETVLTTYLDARPLPWAGFAAESAAWVRRRSEAEGDFVAFTVYCTHVGCPIRWEAGAGLFLCPCHGGAFYADGSVAAGPPPRPLNRYPVRVRNGVVEIQTVGVPEPRRVL